MRVLGAGCFGDRGAEAAARGADDGAGGLERAAGEGGEGGGPVVGFGGGHLELVGGG